MESQSHSCRVLTLLFPFLLLFVSINNINTTSATSSNSTAYKLYVKKSCNSTLYPQDCYKSLSPYASKIKSNPYKLCEYSIYVAYVHAKSASSTASKVSNTSGLTAAEKEAITDCVTEFKDSVDELKQSWDAMDEAIRADVNGTLSEEEKDRMVSDVKTWTSAALTDDDTCKDEIDEVNVNSKVKDKLRKAILKVSKSTSISLAFINSFYS